jgi:DNA polymerase III epsilon subunit-like protein
MNKSYIIFDTETTGLLKNMKADPSKMTTLSEFPRIVQIAWIFSDGIKKEKKNFIIKPSIQIPLESISFHGITQEIAEEKGTDICDVLQNLKNDVEKVNVLVAHNAEFDSKIIASECYRNNITDFMINKNIICTMKSTVKYCELPGKYGFKYPKLEELFYFLFKEKPKGKLHDALYDAEITEICWLNILDKHKDFKWLSCYQSKSR